MGQGCGVSPEYLRSPMTTNSRSLTWLAFAPLVAMTLVTTVDGLAQTTAACSNTYDWMENSKGQSPCLVAAYVQGSCASGDWLVPGLDPGDKYDYPNATTANLCTCSWVTYNLLSACTVCQNLPASNWDAYDQDCGNFLSQSTYFPANITLPVETSIPFWATTNPSSWADAHFDPAAAQTLQQENKPDVNGPSNTPTKGSSKTPIGAIVGGVLGGIAVILLALGIFLCLRAQQRRRDEATGQLIRPASGRGRSMSSMSQKLSAAIGLGSAPDHGRTPSTGHFSSPSDPSVLSHNVAYNPGVSTSGHTSPLSFQAAGTPPVNIEDVIHPFVDAHNAPSVTTRQSIDQPSMTVERTAIASSPPRASEKSLLAAAAFTPARPRLNPPAYTPSETPATQSGNSSQGSESDLYGHARGRREKGSFSTMWSSSASAAPETSEPLSGMASRLDGDMKMSAAAMRVTNPSGEATERDTFLVPESGTSSGAV